MYEREILILKDGIFESEIFIRIKKTHFFNAYLRSSCNRKRKLGDFEKFVNVKNIFLFERKVLVGLSLRGKLRQGRRIMQSNKSGQKNQSTSIAIVYLTLKSLFYYFARAFSPCKIAAVRKTSNFVDNI